MSASIQSHSSAIDNFDTSKLIDVFTSIGEKSMHDMPLYNHAIGYHATEFEVFNEYWIGLLVTPWFLNLMAFPAKTSTQKHIEQQMVGEKCHIALPSGRFEFIKGYNDELESYFSCSLLSPVFELNSKEHAVETLNLALSEIMTPIEPDEHQVVNSSQVLEEQAVSRRDFITGFRKRSQAKSNPAPFSMEANDE